MSAYSFDENSKVCQFGRRFKVEVSSINGNGTMTIFTLPVVFPGTFKVMVITGSTVAEPSGSAQSEVFDLERPSSLCSHPSDLPMKISGGIGGTIYGGSPIVCYGTTNTSPPPNGIVYCYTVNGSQWVPAPSLKRPRLYVSGVSIPPGGPYKYFVTGGQSLLSSEVFDGTTWTETATSFRVYSSSIVAINPFMVFLSGGMQGPSFVTGRQTFFINLTNNQWTPGPDLNQGRFATTGARILNDNQIKSFSTVIIGGYVDSRYIGMTSVEILNDGEKNWQFGPSLPSGIAAASAITDPLGSVYLIGGEGGGLSTKIYR